MRRSEIASLNDSQEAMPGESKEIAIGGLHRVRSHEDEPAWGHLLRAELVGGSRSARYVEGRCCPKRRILEFLAGCDGVTVRDYVKMHGESLILGSMARWRMDRFAANGLPLIAGGRGARRDILPRACQRCVHDGITQYGYAWFQRRHNLAGVGSCYRHGERLFIAGTATERSSFSAELAQLESRSRDAVVFAFVDDFVRRYELALLTLAQRKGRHQTWQVLINLVMNRLADLGLDSGPAAIVDLVTTRANQKWLCETFTSRGQPYVALRPALAKALDHPTYLYHLSLVLAAVFDDLTELSLLLRKHAHSKRIKPLLKAAGCKLRR